MGNASKVQRWVRAYLEVRGPVPYRDIVTDLCYWHPGIAPYDVRVALNAMSRANVIEVDHTNAVTLRTP